MPHPSPKDFPMSQPEQPQPEQPQPQPTAPSAATSAQSGPAIRERVFTLACQGVRSPTIARELGVPERTVRAWMQDLRAQATDDRKAARGADLALAIERQLAISAAAWQGHERAAL